MEEFKWYRDLTVTGMSDFYRHRGGFDVEYLDSPQLRTPPRRMKVTDYGGKTPVGWVMSSRLVLNGDNELVDPILEHRVTPQWLNTVLGEYLFDDDCDETICVNIGRYEGSYLTLTDIEEATDIMVSLYYNEQTYYEVNQGRLADYGLKYDSGLADGESQYEESGLSIDHYQRIVLPLPHNPRSFKLLLQWAEENYARKRQYLETLKKSYDNVVIFRPLFALQAPVAESLNCKLDLESDPYYAKLFNFNGPQTVVSYKYTEEMLMALIHELSAIKSQSSQK